jgi:hypothetical protein
MVVVTAVWTNRDCHTITGVLKASGGAGGITHFDFQALKIQNFDMLVIYCNYRVLL